MIVEKLAKELGQKEEYVANVVALLDEGNTIPFIARYRKELHGSMDDTVLRNLETRLNYLRNLQERKEEVCKSIAAQEKLTEELEKEIMAAAMVENHVHDYFQALVVCFIDHTEKVFVGSVTAVYLEVISNSITVIRTFRHVVLLSRI